MNYHDIDTQSQRTTSPSPKKCTSFHNSSTLQSCLFRGRLCGSSPGLLSPCLPIWLLFCSPVKKFQRWTTTNQHSLLFPGGIEICDLLEVRSSTHHIIQTYSKTLLKFICISAGHIIHPQRKSSKKSKRSWQMLSQSCPVTPTWSLTKNKSHSARSSAGAVHILHCLVCHLLISERLINVRVELNKYTAYHRLTEVRDECKILKQRLKVWLLLLWMTSNWWDPIASMRDATGRKLQDGISCSSRRYLKSQLCFNDGHN